MNLSELIAAYRSLSAAGSNRTPRPSKTSLPKDREKTGVQDTASFDSCVGFFFSA